MADGPVLVERREPVAFVTLNRPEKHNALSLDLLGRLQAVVRDLGEDAAVRVLVLRGNERCFSTGMDLGDLAGVTAQRDLDWLRRFLKNPTAMLATDSLAKALLAQYNNVAMPTLRLADDEVEALLHYIARESRKACVR